MKGGRAGEGVQGWGKGCRAGGRGAGLGEGVCLGRTSELSVVSPRGLCNEMRETLFTLFGHFCRLLMCLVLWLSTYVTEYLCG